MPVAKIIAAKVFGLCSNAATSFDDCLQYARVGLIEAGHMLATASFYANPIATLLRIAGDNVAAVRPRVSQLMNPLNPALTARQRTLMRRILSDSEEHYRNVSSRSAGAAAREETKSAQRFVEALCLVRAAVA